LSSEDEDNSQKCYIKSKHRLICSGNSSACVSVSTIGDYRLDCQEGNDEYIKQLKLKLLNQKCTTPNSIECNVIKAYVQSPSSPSTIYNNKVLSFRQYCDTLWDLPRGFDESLCKKWKCPKHLYQCLTGHCCFLKYPGTFSLLSDWHCLDALEGNGRFYDWHCPDASDNIGLLGITQLSEHNAKLFSDCSLQQLKNDLIDVFSILAYLPFTKFCNLTKEYGCILANVNDPLNFIINRPCINMTQIGDGIIDCYGGLDERNLLSCGNNSYEQRGFDFHCSDQECIPYSYQCEKRCSNNADSLLCDQIKPLNSIESMIYYSDIERSGK
jgi:hypothetical protein